MSDLDGDSRDAGGRAGERGGDGPDADRGTDEDGSGRDVAVPLRLYKTVTVFSTLFAVAFVLAGFLLLDVATNRARAPLDEVDPLVAVAGLAAIAAGGVIYAFSTRFRATGMGTPKDEAGESDDNG